MAFSFGATASPQQKKKPAATPPASPFTPTAPETHADPWLAIMQQWQQQQQAPTAAHDPFAGLAALLHTPTKHLGMSGEDITNKPAGPYDSGGIDWLKSHNDKSGGNVQLDPNAMMATQNAYPGLSVIPQGPPQPSATPLLPFTQALRQPTPAKPAAGSPNYPQYAASVYEQLQQMLSNRTPKARR